MKTKFKLFIKRLFAAQPTKKSCLDELNEAIYHLYVANLHNKEIIAKNNELIKTFKINLS